MKNLQEIKEEVAAELGYKSNSVFSAYEQLLINPHGLNYKVIINYNDQIAIRYAEERNKELVGFVKSIVSDYENGLIDDIEHVAIRAEQLIQIIQGD